MQTSNHDVIRQKIAEIEKQLASLKVQQAQAEATLSSLKEQLAKTAEPTAPQSSNVAAAALTPKEKVALFLRLFRGRDDVYPKLWQNQKSGKKGYSPACANEWVRGVCE